MKGAGKMLRPTWAEVDLGAIVHNVEEIKRYIGAHCKLMAVVKADGYGYGAVPCARAALKGGAEYLAVATADEGVALREAGIMAPILVMGASIPGCGEEKLVELGITQAISTPGMAEAVAQAADKLGKKALVHVKIETGMGRTGIPPSEAIDYIAYLMQTPQLKVEGMFTHFPTAEEEDKNYTQGQFRQFMGLIGEMKARGIEVPLLKHVCNSGAILDLPEMHLDLVRAGSLIYGLYPSPYVKRPLSLRPALSLKTRIVFLKEVPAGTGISYSLTYFTDRRTKIATLPVGYADGYRRELSNKGQVLVRGRRAPIVGRICMDQCLIDVGAVPGVAVGDEVVLIGRQGKEEITATELADLTDTLSGAFTVGLGKRVPRLYKG